MGASLLLGAGRRMLFAMPRISVLLLVPLTWLVLNVGDLASDLILHIWRLFLNDAAAATVAGCTG